MFRQAQIGSRLSTVSCNDVSSGYPNTRDVIDDLMNSSGLCDIQLDHDEHPERSPRDEHSDAPRWCVCQGPPSRKIPGAKPRPAPMLPTVTADRNHPSMVQHVVDEVSVGGKAVVVLVVDMVRPDLVAAFIGPLPIAPGLDIAPGRQELMAMWPSAVTAISAFSSAPMTRSKPCWRFTSTETIAS
jgi:hypothetical protein